MRTFPRWVSVLFVLFLGYILVVGNVGDHAPTPRPAPAPDTPVEPTQPSYPAISALRDGERWARAINPDYKAAQEACRAAKTAEGTLENFAIIEQMGEGEPVACGEPITVAWQRWNNAGTAGKLQTQTLTLGEQPAMDALLVGMQKGERRLLILRLPERIQTLTLPPRTQLLLSVTRVADETKNSLPQSSE